MSDKNYGPYEGYITSYSNLHEAAIGGSPSDMDGFIYEGAAVNGKDAIGKTPLHEAAYFGNPRNVKALIEREADIEARDNMGRTPLHLACTNHPMSQEMSTRTRVTGAENKGYRFGASFLLDAGADIQAKDSDGWTPLHHAAFGASKPLVEELIKRGADVNAKDNDGILPVDVARVSQRFQIADLLSGRMAETSKKQTADLER